MRAIVINLILTSKLYFHVISIIWLVFIFLVSFNLVGSNSPTLGSALIFFCYKESPARREAREGVRNTPLLAAGIGWPSGDSLF